MNENVANVPEALWAVPGWNALLITLTVCALCAFTVTWVIRTIAKDRFGSWFLRLVSAVVGIVSGWMIAGLPWGPIVGLGSGSLTTTVYAVIKARLAQMGGKKS